MGVKKKNPTRTGLEQPEQSSITEVMIYIAADSALYKITRNDLLP